MFKKLLLTTAIITGTLNLAPAAFAGEGGIAASAAFNLDGFGSVLNASVGIAIGKTSAYAGATAFDDGAGSLTTEAFAAGTGSALTLTGTDIYIQSITEESATNLGVAQANEIDSQTINIDAVNGTTDFSN